MRINRRIGGGGSRCVTLITRSDAPDLLDLSPRQAENESVKKFLRAKAGPPGFESFESHDAKSLPGGHAESLRGGGKALFQRAIGRIEDRLAPRSRVCAAVAVGDDRGELVRQAGGVERAADIALGIGAQPRLVGGIARRADGAADPDSVLDQHAFRHAPGAPGEDRERFPAAPAAASGCRWST